eukprot:3377949-Prymnesium_polylepis.2
MVLEDRRRGVDARLEDRLPRAIDPAGRARVAASRLAASPPVPQDALDWGEAARGARRGAQEDDGLARGPVHRLPIGLDVEDGLGASPVEVAGGRHQPLVEQREHAARLSRLEVQAELEERFLSHTCRAEGWVGVKGGGGRACRLQRFQRPLEPAIASRADLSLSRLGAQERLARVGAHEGSSRGRSWPTRRAGRR